MEKLKIKETEYEPAIIFDPANDLFAIRGKIISENPVKFFQPILEWSYGYIRNPNNKTEIILQIEYINTSSSKILLQLLKIYEKLNLENGNVSIIWLFEDEGMYDAGYDYQSMLKIPFELIKNNNE